MSGPLPYWLLDVDADAWREAAPPEYDAAAAEAYARGAEAALSRAALRCATSTPDPAVPRHVAESVRAQLTRQILTTPPTGPRHDDRRPGVTR